MAEVKAAEKGRQSEHLEKEVSSRGNCTSSSKTVDKEAVRTILTAPLQNPICAFTLGLLLRTAALRVSGSTLTTALVSKCRLVITGYDFWTGKPV